MVLMPKRVKYRKEQRMRIRGHATRGTTVAFGEYGLMALERAWVSARQIEAMRVIASRNIGHGKYWLRVFPHKPISDKPAETRMGKGKGEVEWWAAVVKPGHILLEVGGTTEEIARQIFRLQAMKLPIRVKMVKR
jgi:large subunit ribosomal protein L16